MDDLRLFDNHRSPYEQTFGVMRKYFFGDLIAYEVMLYSKNFKPEQTELRQNLSFVRNAVWHHPVKSTDAIGTHDSSLSPKS